MRKLLIAVVALFSVSITVYAQAEDPAGQTLAALPPEVVITGVVANHSSARVYYQPVTGAADYRIYDAAVPESVKYAGLVHLTADPACPGDASCSHRFAMQADGTPAFPYRVERVPSNGPQVLDVPATDIEWNGLGDGHVHTLIAEAVDLLGPAPQANLYTSPTNGPDTPLAPNGMLGSNKGATGDGNVSTNGQGPYTNAPHVIARSRSFIVTPKTGYAAIPSGPSAVQQFYDSFENPENGTVHLVSRSEAGDTFGNVGVMRYGMNAGTPKEWAFEYRNADNTNSMPFVSNDHFMDMLFDGATPPPVGGGPSHTLYSSMAMTPKQTVDMSNGKVLHMTMEVDGHFSFGRWPAFNLAPASDPLQGFAPINHQINTTDRGVFLELFDGYCTMSIFTGPASATDSKPTGTAGASVARGGQLWGLDGAAGANCSLPQMYNPAQFSKNGLGLDDRSRYDFFISETHASLFQDGRLIVQSDIPAGSFPWADEPMQAYYTHYLYHSESEMRFMLHTASTFGNAGGMCYPMNSYWFNTAISGTAASANVCNIAYPSGYGFPFSDERHWDNMGFEVLPDTSDFSTFAAMVALPTPESPVFTTTTSPTATAVPSTAVPTSVPNTPVPANTVVPTVTATPSVPCRVSVELAGTPGPYKSC